MSERINGKFATRVPITAVWLRRSGDTVEVLVEIEAREWRLAITEHIEGPFSHIAEGNGAKRWPLDDLAERAQEKG